MAGRTSLKDIATASGMSVSTVSLALSGDLRVSETTRERIREVAKRLGYVRDPILASIAAGRFRHPGKPVCVAISGDGEAWTSKLKAQAEPMGMSVHHLDGPVETLPDKAIAVGASALVLYRRHVMPDVLARNTLPVVLWEDEGPADSPVDVVETCEWWTATSGAVERVLAAGYRAPVAVLTPASPRHWHDDIRHTCLSNRGIPVFEWMSQEDDAKAAAFVKANGADAVVAGMPHVQDVLQRHDLRLPLASLLLHEGPWFSQCSGWMPDQDHRGQVTLELIEMRLRYGPRPPRRVIIPPRWQDGSTLPNRVV